MTHRQALHAFPDVSNIAPYKQQNQLTSITAVPSGSREVTVALNVIRERTAFILLYLDD
jgi:hypothetical protein